MNTGSALAIVVGLIAAAVAFGSFWIAREKLRFDLFDKRFKVFEGARLLVSRALRTGALSMDELLEFRATAIGKEFLFSGEVVDYLNKIDQYAVRIVTMGPVLRKSVGVAPVDAAALIQLQKVKEQHEEALNWMVEQLQQLTARFAPDMQIEWSPWRRLGGHARSLQGSPVGRAGGNSPSTRA